MEALGTIGTYQTTKHQTSPNNPRTLRTTFSPTFWHEILTTAPKIVVHDLVEFGVDSPEDASRRSVPVAPPNLSPIKGCDQNTVPLN